MKFNRVISLFLMLFLITHLQATTGNEKEGMDNIASSAEKICPLLVGAPVPDLKLNSVEGKEFDLKKAITQKPSVLVFYRGGWCPFCNLQLAELKDIEDELINLGYQMIAVSMDRPEKLRKSKQKHQMKYTLLSDSSAIAAKKFGLAFKAEDKYVRKLKTLKMDIEQASGRDHHILPVPAVFLVGKDGIIKFEYINPNYKVRLKSRILLEMAKAELVKEPL